MRDHAPVVLITFGLLILLLVMFYYVHHLQRELDNHRAAHAPRDSSIAWISTERLNNIDRAANDMHSMSRVLEGMYQEMIYQERRADSLQFLLESPP